MASDDLIRTVVAQVMERLQTAGLDQDNRVGGGHGAGGGRAAPGAGRRDMAGGGSQGIGSREGSAYLVVLTAGDALLDEVYRQIGRLGDAGAALRIFLSPSARKLLNLTAVRRACPRAEILPAEVTFELRDLVEGSDAVFIPTLTLSTASKIAMLDGDTAASLMPIYALMRGKPVIAARNSVYGLRADYPAPPAGFKRRVDKIFANLAEVGVQVVDIGELASFPLGAAGAVSKGTGQAEAPPATLSGAASATAPVSRATTPPAANAAPCGNDPQNCTGCGQCAEKNEPAVKELVHTGAARIGAAAGTKVDNREVAGMIDHTLLKADATEEDIRKLCAEAREHFFASVCVNPSYVALAARLLEGSPVKVCTVIGFPLGATTPTAKAIETRDAIANGAEEIDMVINVGALKSGDDELVRRDIAAVVESARGKGLVKVILETALLSREEKVKACLLAKMAGADFVKTSTGFSTGGATVDDIALMRETVGPEMGVKASGGIKSAEDAQAMIAAGATRIGASASVAIAKGTRAAAGAY